MPSTSSRSGDDAVDVESRTDGVPVGAGSVRQADTAGELEALGVTRRPAPLVLPPILAADASMARYVSQPDVFKPGNHLTPLVDGAEAFPAMLEAIARAQRCVHLETYILADDAVGRRFAAALSERAAAGIPVRLLYDGLGSLGLPHSYTAPLVEAGVRVVAFRPLSWRNRHRWARRDHRKLLVVDNRVAFTGGINICSDNAAHGDGGAGWRDTHIRITGPVVADLEHTFRATWLLAGGEPYRPYPRMADESVATADSHLAAALDSRYGRRTQIRRHYLHAIRAASEHIYIANAYFVPDHGIQRALIRAARRGVDVRVIVPACSDVRLVQLAGEHTYARLLRHGVALLQWPQTHMHAKTAVIDGVWSAVGSYNLDYVSLFDSLEVVVVAIGRRLGTAMTSMFRADAARCEALTLAGWRSRPWWRRLASWLAYRFRRWM